MAMVRGAMLEDAAAGADRVVDRAADDRRADRLVAAAEALGNDHHVRHHGFPLQGPGRAAPTHAAHHFVDAEEDAVPVADLAQAPELPRETPRGHEVPAD